MRWDLGMRRVAPGLFVLALITLLVAPVGSSARLPHHQTSAGPTQSKTAVSALRAQQPAFHVDASDRFQLDPTTSPDELDSPLLAESNAVDLTLTPSADGHRGDAAARGPPAP